jgi:hypothetical protein
LNSWIAFVPETPQPLLEAAGGITSGRSRLWSGPLPRLVTTTLMLIQINPMIDSTCDHIVVRIPSTAMISASVNNRIALGVAFACALLLGACSSRGPVRFSGEHVSLHVSDAVLWTHTRYGQSPHYPDNRMRVGKIDGVGISARGAPVVLSPGRHSAEIFHDRHVTCLAEWIGGAFGDGYCYQPQGIFTLEWLAEPGHSYMPFAFYHCGRNWAWIEDTGQSAAHDVEKIRGYFSLAPEIVLSDDVRARDRTGKKIVAGEHPPDACAPTTSHRE